MLPTDENKYIIHTTLSKYCYDGLFDNKKVVIFGCTLFASEIINVLRNHNIIVSYFVDNDTTKTDTLCSGVVVKHTDYLLNETLEEVIVIISSPKYCHEMTAQVESFGLGSENILVIPVKNINEINDSLLSLYKAIEEIQKGVELYNSILLDDLDMLFVFPYPGTGDIYVACGYLNTYLNTHNIKSYRLVVTKKNCKEVAKMFGYDDIIVISDEEKENLIKAWQFLGSEHIRIKPLLFWGWHCKNYYRTYRKNKQLSFIDYFKYDVFNLPKQIDFQYPIVAKNESYIEKLFEYKHLSNGKTVIIAPYAGSFVSSVSMSSWEEIVKELKNKGYKVCTNCYGKETPIKGSIPIQFPYSEVVNVLDSSGIFIGIRSGLCDIASQSNCLMIIIYESNFLASDYEFFSLNKMGLNKNVYEIEYENDSQIVNDIVQIVFE